MYVPTKDLIGIFSNSNHMTFCRFCITHRETSRFRVTLISRVLSLQIDIALCRPLPAIRLILCAYNGLLFIPIKKPSVLSIPKKTPPPLPALDPKSFIYGLGFTNRFNKKRKRERENCTTMTIIWLLSCQKAHIVWESCKYICTRTPLREPGFQYNPFGKISFR